MTTKYKIISTVGTSLLNNFKRTHGLSDRQNKAFIKDPTILLNFIKEIGAKAASSETNSIDQILEELGTNQTHITFLCSETEECEICAKALKMYYKEKGIEAEIITVEGLRYDEKKFEAEGLKNLVNHVINQIRFSRKEKITPIINATPGFKAEAAILTVLSMLFKVDTYYIHEKFRDLVKIPSIPIEFDQKLWNEVRDALDYLRITRTKKEFIEKYGEKILEKIKPLIQEENGEIRLSPIGIAYYEAGIDRYGKK